MASKMIDKIRGFFSKHLNGVLLYDLKSMHPLVIPFAVLFNVVNTVFNMALMLVVFSLVSVLGIVAFVVLIPVAIVSVLYEAKNEF